jgi:hypothetical protein
MKDNKIKKDKIQIKYTIDRSGTIVIFFHKSNISLTLPLLFY